MKKKLFIVSLKFPLINAINLMVNHFDKQKTDLILVDNGSDMSAIAARLRCTNIFDKVVLVKLDQIKTFKHFLRLLPCPFCGSEADIISSGMDDEVTISCTYEDKNSECAAQLWSDDLTCAKLAWNQRKGI